MATFNIKPGRYQHFKGMVCEVIGVARHSETLEPMVVYKEEGTGEQWVRPAAMFQEVVEVNGVHVPRFKYIAE
jgi:hypothetical protein